MNSRMIDAIKLSNVLEKMTAFDKAHDKKALFQVMRHYMCMVMEMLTFIRAEQETGEIHKIFFCARHDQPCTDDACLPLRDGWFEVNRS